MLNKKEFIEEVSRRSKLSDYIIDEIYHVSSELVAETLIHDEDIEIPTLGTFSLNRKEAKNLFGNVAGDESKVCIYPSFKISNKLRERVKNNYKR